MNDEIPAAGRTVTASDNREKIDKLTVEDLIVDSAPLAARLARLKEREAQLPAAPEPDATLEWLEAHGAIVQAFGRDVTIFLADVADEHQRTKKPYFDIGKLVDQQYNGVYRDGANPMKAKAAGLADKFVDAKATIERKRLEDLATEQTRIANARLEAAAKAEEEGDHVVAQVLQAQAEHSDKKAESAAHLSGNSIQNLGAIRTAGGGSMSTSKKLDWDIDRATVDLDALRPYLDLDAISKAIRAFNKPNGNVMNGATPLIKTPIKGVTFKAVGSGTFRG